MRSLLLSTYELGHQPLHLAAPAAVLAGRGHEVRAIDLGREAWGPAAEADLSWAQALAISVPMHTAMRLAISVCRAVRQRRPELPICLYGLYAGLAASAELADLADLVIAGEYTEALVAFVDEAGKGRPARGLGRAGAVRVELGRGRPAAAQVRPRPARQLLQPLSHYARLSMGGTERLAGYVEASSGCSQRCRHCPVPVVYDGRTRFAQVDAVLADVAQLVSAGATHITFGDPDFLNGPAHARRVVAAVHGAFPALSFDCTVKVSHILAQAGLWEEWAGAGCLFVVSALESTDDAVLARLDKGHTVADASRAVDVLRRAGVALRPSWLPFTPWTTPESMAGLMAFTARHGLVAATDTVQLAVRLLVPPGSLLLSDPTLRAALGPYDADALTWTWRYSAPGLDDLQRSLANLAEQAAATNRSPLDAWPEACHLVAEATGRPEAAEWAQLPAQEGGVGPRLTEPWFC